MFALCKFSPSEILLFLLLAVPLSLLAARKGYKWYLWMFAFGLVGLIVLAFLPFANKAEQSPEEQQRLRSNGNAIGRGLTASSLVLWVTYHLLWR
jgi:hypothetical protein